VTNRFRFAEFEADLRTGELWRNGERVRIQDLPFRLLAALLERPGELVTRAEATPTSSSTPD
jgi:DNA-binding winged helix-turn-helix (wHTH) protein